MRFVTLLAAIGMAFGAQGVAGGPVLPQVVLEDEMSRASNYSALDSPSDSYCTTIRTNFTFFFQIYLSTWGQDTDGCGKGLLDNLRGQCGVVNQWGCDPMADNSAYVTFWLALTIPSHCVENAIWIASPSGDRATGVNCRLVTTSGR
jgi:hypothetical protein